MKLCFDSIEEVKDFVTQLKGTRGGKGSKDETETTASTTAGGAPAPMQPPAGGGAVGFGDNAAGGFPSPGPSFAPPAGPSPEVQALVNRIITKTDSAIAGGQNPEQARAWFASQCGAEAANATLDTIKASFLPKLAVPQLTQIASLLAA